MSLPTTNLTLHCDASDTDKLFTTMNGGGSGIHTGTPANGDPVQVWEDEGDGISNVIIRYTGTGAEPTFRSGGSALMKTGLTELDFDGLDDQMDSYTQDGSTGVIVTSFITAAAGTMAIVFYPESITDTDSDPTKNHGLLGDKIGSFGIALRDVSGTKKVRAYNNDGAIDTVELTVATSRVWIALWVHGGGTLTLYVIDDTRTETSVSVASGDTTDLISRLNIGQIQFINGKFYNGRIGEFAIWSDEKTGSDLTAIKNTLSDKWLSGVAGLPFIATIGAKRF